MTAHRVVHGKTLVKTKTPGMSCSCLFCHVARIHASPQTSGEVLPYINSSKTNKNKGARPTSALIFLEAQNNCWAPLVNNCGIYCK